LRGRKLIKVIFFLLALFSLVLLACEKNKFPLGPNRASNYYYYSDGRKIELKLVVNELSVGFINSASEGQIQELIQQYGLSIISKVSLTTNQYLLGAPQGGNTDEFYTRYGDCSVSGFGNEPVVTYSCPVFNGSDGTKMLLTDEFIVKFDSTITQEEVEMLNAGHQVEIVQIDPLMEGGYVLKATKVSERNALDMANFYYELSITLYGHPNWGMFINFP